MKRYMEIIEKLDKGEEHTNLEKAILEVHSSFGEITKQIQHAMDVSNKTQSSLIEDLKNIEQNPDDAKGYFSQNGFFVDSMLNFTSTMSVVDHRVKEAHVKFIANLIRLTSTHN